MLYHVPGEAYLDLRQILRHSCVGSPRQMPGNGEAEGSRPHPGAAGEGGRSIG